MKMKNNGDKSGLLGICRKAGKLKLGMDMAKGACGSGEAKAVFAASDLSKKSLKEIRFSCGRNSVKLYALAMDMQQIADAVGKRTGILAVTDGGFAKALANGSAGVSFPPCGGRSAC